MYFNRKIEISNFRDFYKELAKQCEHQTSFSCCISSVHAMEDGNYMLSKNNVCPTGFTLNMIRCADSFKWCEPIKR